MPFAPPAPHRPPLFLFLFLFLLEATRRNEKGSADLFILFIPRSARRFQAADGRFYEWRRSYPGPHSYEVPFRLLTLRVFIF